MNDAQSDCGVEFAALKPEVCGIPCLDTHPVPLVFHVCNFNQPRIELGGDELAGLEILLNQERSDAVAASDLEDPFAGIQRERSSRVRTIPLK